MSSRITVDDLISNVRSQLAEENRESITDADDILPAMNRAQDFGMSVLARHYPDPLLTHEDITLTSGVQEYPVPETAFEQRLERLEVKVNNLYYPVQKINYTEASAYESSLSSSSPLYWCMVGSSYRLFPNTSSTYPIRIWYLKEPMPLVNSQGRINIINSVGNYVIVDSIGSALTTESDTLASYVNIIDGASGVRKGTFQIQNIVDNKITFKTAPIRSSVLDTTVDTSISTLSTGFALAADDYVCLVPGTCVPFMKKPLSNFIVQYAVAEMRRKLGEAEGGLEDQVLKKFEEQIQKTWGGRTSSFRIANKSNNWPSSSRRIITQG